MADKTEGSITIDADPATIMGVIADFERYPEWSSEIKKVEVRARGADGRATDVYFEVSAGPISPKYTLHYEYGGNRSVSWKMTEGTQLRNIEGEYVLDADGDATKVTYRASVELAVPMLGFMKRQGEKRVIDTALKGLKKRVESL
jgi:ribosome-associated toxin RatA of RatAB toxin-antitoxin module